MTLADVENEQSRARQPHARLLVDIAAAPEDAARYDLPPTSAGLELQQQVVAALANSSFLAGADISAQPHHRCPEKHPEPATTRTDISLNPDDFPRLRARVIEEAADALAWVWRGDTAKEQIKFLRDLAHQTSLHAPDTRLHPTWDRDGSRRRQFVEVLAVADPEQLRRMAIDLVDQNVELRQEVGTQSARAGAAELNVEYLSAALSRTTNPPEEQQ